MSLIFIAVLLFLVLSFILLIGIAFSKDEFNRRNSWKILRPATRKVDWERVDAGIFAFFALFKLWQALGLFILVLYLGGAVWRVIS